MVVTRPLTFSGEFLFVNADVRQQLRVEVVDRSGRVIPDFALDKCEPVRGNATRAAVRWSTGASLRALAGQPVRLRFVLNDADLFAFWVSQSARGESGGYVAAGGPGFNGQVDGPH
jgi:hypothetical protein